MKYSVTVLDKYGDTVDITTVEPCYVASKIVGYYVSGGFLDKYTFKKCYGKIKKLRSVSDIVFQGLRERFASDTERPMYNSEYNGLESLELW